MRRNSECRIARVEGHSAMRDKSVAVVVVVLVTEQTMNSVFARASHKAVVKLSVCINHHVLSQIVVLGFILATGGLLELGLMIR